MISLRIFRLCEQCYGDSLNSRHKSIIDRCVRKLYTDIAREKEKHIPTMTEFYGLLLEQPKPETKDIALALELFVNGSLNIVNNHTNVNVQARFLVYGTRGLGKELGANIYIPFGKRYGSWVAGIPETQLRFVNNSPSGTRIIKHGGVCIPFDNRMGKEENPIYALFNTNLHETKDGSEKYPV